MAVYHLKTGGTKPGTAASTPGDWTASNCYGTWQLAITAISSTGADGDSIIVDDEMFVAAANAVGALNITGTITITSRSGNPALSGIVSSVATGALLLSNSTTNTCNVVWENLTLRKSVTHTDTARPVIHHMAQHTGNVTFRNCDFADIDINIPSGLNWYFGLATNDAGAGYGTVIRFEDCGFNRISGTYAANGVLFAFSTGSAKRIEVVRPTIRTITAVNPIGGFVVTSGADLYWWDVDVDGWTASAPATTCGGILKTYSYSAGSFMYGRRAKFKNVTVNANVCDTLISTVSPFDIKDILGISVNLVSSSKSDGGQGSLFMAIYATAQGNIENIRAFDCHSNYGPAAYWSAGAGGTYRNIWAEQCSAGTGIVYKGGGGDICGSLTVVKDCWQRVETGLLNEALAFYGHIHATTGDHNTVISLRDFICVGGTPLAGSPDVRYNNPNTTYTLEGTATRVVVRDNTIGMDMVGRAVNLTATDCNLLGGSAAIVQSQLSGTLTESGTTDVAVVVVGGLSVNSELTDRWPVAYRVAA